MSLEDHPEAAPAQVGGYALGRVLGQGGFATVYEGRGADGRQVAVKLLRAGAGAEAQARLRQEARIGKGLRHPGIAAVIGSCELPRGPALVLEHLEGATLEKRLAAGPAPLPLALRWVRQAAEALACAHGQGVVHRDIKPGNLFIVTATEDARVLDFGVARWVSAPAALPSGAHTQPDTAEGGLLGTPRYMAPEQFIDARQAGPAADVFALGAVLYEALCGVPAFPDSMAARPAPELRGAAVPGWLSRLVAAMLDADPEKRPGMAEVAAALAPLPAGRCPFPGLEPFGEEDAALLPGREREVAEAVARLRRGARWLQIEGASGSGKSSFLRAGLVPAWRAGQGGTFAGVLVARPGMDPLLDLAQVLQAAWPQLGSVDAVLARLARPVGLRYLLREVTRPGQAVVLALDPFEELLAGEGDVMAQVDRLLDAALEDADGPLRLVTALRSDFVGQLGLLPRLERRLNQAARFHLPLMDEAGLREALLGPCARAGLRCEPGLAERVVADTAGLTGCLPLLGHALRTVYAGRSGDLLTLDAYQRSGGVAGALARATEDLLAGLGEEGRARARGLLLALVHIGRGAQDTRRPRPRAEALIAAGGGAEAERVLLRLSGRDARAPAGAPAQVRLVVADGDRVELIHEALLQHMPALRQWVAEDRRLLERRDELDTAAAAWRAMDCPREGLPRGAVLGYYEGAGLAAGDGARLAELASPEARAFLAAARAQETRRRRWRRASAGLLAVAAAAFLGLAGVAVREWRHAEARQVIALGYMNEAQRTVDGELTHLPDSEYVRGKLLGLSARALDALAEAGVGGWQLAEVRFGYELQRASLLADYRSLAEAEVRCRQAVAEADIVLRSAPDPVLGRRLGVEGRLELGDLLRQQERLPESLAALHEAEGLLAGLPEATSRQLRARTARYLAMVYLDAGRYQDAKQALQQADALDQEETRGFLYYDLGRAELGLGNWRAAKKAFDQAMAIQVPLQHDAPGYLNYPWLLGRILAQAAIAQARLGDLQGARSSIAQAVERLEWVQARSPTNQRYQRTLAEIRRAAQQAGVPLTPAPGRGAPQIGG